MLCGKITAKKGRSRVTVALPLASTAALTLWPSRVNVTVPPLAPETWTLMVSIGSPGTPGRGLSEMLLNVTEEFIRGGGGGGAGGSDGAGCGSKAPSDGI